MKKLTTVICIICLIVFAAIDLSAQDTRFGLKGGATFYKGTVEASLGFINIEMTSDTHLGFAGGIFAEFPINDLISIQPEILYMQKNSKESDDFFDIGFDDFDDFDDERATTNLSYIDVPLLLRLNIPIDGNISPYVAAGPFVGYLLDAKAKVDGDTEDLKEFMKDINYGLIFAAGLNFGKVGVEFRYDLGMANIFDEDALLNGDFDDDDFDDDFGFGGIDVSAKLSGFSVMLTIGF